MNRWIGIGAGAVLLIGAVVAYVIWGMSYPTWVVTEDLVGASGDHYAFGLSLKGRDDDPKIDPLLEIRCDNHKLRVALHVGDIPRLGGGMDKADVSIAELFTDNPNEPPTWDVNWILPQDSMVAQRPDPAAFIRKLTGHPWFLARHGTDGNFAVSAKFQVKGLDTYLPKLEAACGLTDQADAEEAGEVMAELSSFHAVVKPVTNQVYFEFASVVPTPEALEALKLIAQRIRDDGWERVVVIGHADTLEGETAGWKEAFTDCINALATVPHVAGCPPDERTARRISVLRAQAVVDALVKFGVPRAHLTAIGVATDDAAVATPPLTREPLNRRVVIDMR